MEIWTLTIMPPIGKTFLTMRVSQCLDLYQVFVTFKHSMLYANWNIKGPPPSSSSSHKRRYEESSGPHTPTPHRVKAKRSKKQKNLLPEGFPIVNSIFLQDMPTKASHQDHPLPIWCPRPIPYWEAASKATIITRKRQLELFLATSDRIVVNTKFTQVVPSYTLFTHGDNQRIFLYNWALAAPMWFYLLDTGINVKSYSQKSQAWRETLVNRFSIQSDEKTLRLESLGITPCSDKLPNPPWNLTWREIPIPDQQTLLDPSFLAALMWEISETAFLYSLFQLDHEISSKIPNSSSEERQAKRDDILMIWHGHPSLTPQFDEERTVESQDILHTRKELLLALCEFMSIWPRFPAELDLHQVKTIDTPFGVLHFESILIAFYAQIFADHYSRPAPLPCIRPSLPLKN